MATSANISRFKFLIVNGASPEVLTAIEEVVSVSNVGKTNSLVDVTNFDSPTGTREYIAGLADGDEITVEANYVPAATMQALVMGYVDSGLTKSCRLSYQGASPEKRWSFNAVCLGYSVAPSPTEQNRITFTFKITGDVTRS